MSKVIIKVAETAELVVDITDKVISDYTECEKLANMPGDGKDCDTCSLDMAEEFCMGLCDMKEVKDAIEKRRRNEKTKV